MNRPLQIIDLTSGTQHLKWSVFLFFILILICPLRVIGQTDNGPVSINMDFITWKSGAEADQTITTERGRIDELLNAPGLNQADQSIYKAYRLLLSYVRQNVQNNIPMDEAITKGYEQVIKEAPKNPELAKLPDQMLGTYLPGLVEMLSAVPVPEPR